VLTDFSAARRLGYYVTSEEMFYIQCNKTPTEVSKRGPDEWNFIESNPPPSPLPCIKEVAKIFQQKSVFGQ
jgi:hypothetical protein